MSNLFHIPTPCHENWNEMSPEEQGRHCTKCSKTVFDVSAWSDEEIDHKYVENGNSLCIRIPSERVAPIPVQDTKSRTWKYYLVSGLAAFWLMIKKNFATAQTDSTEHKQEPKILEEKIVGMEITGIVVDTINQEQPIVYADIIITRDGEVLSGAITDEQGRYSLKLTDTLSTKDTLSIRIESLGYTSVTKEFTPTDSLDMEIFMSEGHVCLKGMTIAVDRRRIIQGGWYGDRTMGVISRMDGKRSIKRRLLDEYDTKSYHHDELERYNLGR